MTAEQLSLDQLAGKKNQDSKWLINFLSGKDWITAHEILVSIGVPPTENNKRRLRLAADQSGGHVAGHQRGYKLVEQMTNDEYNWWRNEWLKAADNIRARVVESDRVFYARQSAN